MAKGMIYFALGVTCFACYTLSVKVALVKYSLNVPELSYYNSFILIGAFYFLAKKANVNILAIKNKVKKDLFLRTITGFAADLGLFVAFTFTTFSRANCLFFTHPMLLPFLAKGLIGEKIKLWDIIGIIIGFVGVLFLVQPWKKPSSSEEAHDMT